jgi:hypothetical protein
MEFHHTLLVLRNSTVMFNFRVHVITRLETKIEVVVCFPVGLLGSDK